MFSLSVDLSAQNNSLKIKESEYLMVGALPDDRKENMVWFPLANDKTAWVRKRT